MKNASYLFAIALLAIASCGRKGCTDPHALNYSEKAKKDCGKCTYPTQVCVKSVRVEFDNINPVTGEPWDEFDGPDVFCQIYNNSYPGYNQQVYYVTDTLLNIADGVCYFELQPNEFCVTPTRIDEDGNASWRWEEILFGFSDYDAASQNQETMGHYLFLPSDYTKPHDENSYPTMITQNELIDFGNNINQGIYMNLTIRIELEWK